MHERYERHLGFGTPMLAAADMVFIEFPFEGRTATALIDTGANVLAIDPSVEVDRTFLRKAKHGGGRASRETADVVRIPFPRLSTGEILPVEALEAPLGHLSACVGRPIDFVVGFPVLREMVLSIDYPERRVYLADGCGDVPESAWLEAAFRGREILFPIEVEGQRVEKMLVDTGAGTSLLAPEKIVELRLPKVEDKVAIAVDCLGQRRERPFFVASSVKMGGRNLAGVEFMESDHQDVDRNGIVGGNLLGNFEVVVDYPRKRLALL